MAGSMVYRTRIQDLDTSHTVKLKAAFSKIQGIQDNRGYNHISGFHGIPGQYCWHNRRSRRTLGLEARLFLPWHRAYLWWLEQAMQDQEKGASLPWWDWTKTRKIPDIYEAANDGGVPNPLKGFTPNVPMAPDYDGITTSRTPGADPRFRLATTREIDNLITIRDWATFSDRLQNYHNHVHMWVGGSMTDPNVAAFDPIFFAHHSMIDRIWYLWQLKNGVATISPGLLNLPLEPFGKTVKNVLEIQELGYEYADSTASFNLD